MNPRPARATAADWIRAAARRHPDRLYLDDVGEDRRLTFGEVDDRVRRLAVSLDRLGVRRGDRVAILAVDSHRYVETLFASMRIGTTFVPLNTRLSERELGTLVSAAAASVLFVSSRYVALARRVAMTAGVEHLICYDDPSSYEALVSSAADTDVRIAVDDHEILGLAFTSGTTGRPKGVLQSQRMVKDLTAATLLCWETLAEETYYAGAPLFHISAMSMVFMGALRGFTSVIAPGFDPAQTLSWLQNDRLTSLFLVPTMISSVLQQPGVADSPYERLRAIHYGAAPMPLPLLRRAMAVFGCDFVQAFGAGTESGWNTVLGSAEHRRALAGEEQLLASVGLAATTVDLRLCDDEWIDVPRGSIGEVVVRSDMIMSGYLDMPEETERALHPDGWFRAGDLGYQDEQGYLYLVGRKRDLVVRGGENVYPAEVDAVLCEHPAVLECAVVGVPDEHWGEVLRAHVVFREGVPQPTNEELVSFCRQQLAQFKVPTLWSVEKELPKNASGKIVKHILAGERC
jgi:acyl-CoA synthetase (AMP-forming)/AMP-acid ligase II